MMTFQIVSPKYGTFTVKVDDEDYHFVTDHKWCIVFDDSTTRIPYIKCSEFTHFTIENGKRKNHNNNFILHRLILGLIDPKIKTDHIDGDTFNNQKSNLRRSTDNTNGKNKRKFITNKSGYKGVHFEKKANAFRATIGVNYKRIFGGYFSTAIAAAKKYNELAVRHHGEFARLNPIP